MSMPRKDYHISKNFRPYKDEKFIPKEQNIEKDQRNLIIKNLDIGSYSKNSMLRRIF